MASKIYCFNGGIFKKNLQRFWLLPLAMLVSLYLSIPNMLNSYIRSGVSIKGDFVIDNVLGFFNHSFVLFAATIAAFACFAAWACFSYLYKSNSSYMLHSLPVTRNSLFFTDFLSGLFMQLLPMLLCAVICFVQFAVYGLASALVGPMLRYFAAGLLVMLFFYGFAVFCAMLTANVIVMPLLYIVLNFTVVVVEILIRLISGMFIYGMTDATDTVTLTEFSPFVRIAELCERLQDALATGSFWLYIALIAAAGIIFSLLALLLYKKRRLETAGDVIAYPFLRPVFKYCFTFGCAVVLGFVFYFFMALSNEDAGILNYIICLLAGAFIGYFAAEMMMRKSLRVFKSTWKGFLAAAGGILLLCACFYFDFFGIAAYVPESGNIKSIQVRVQTVDGTKNYFFTMPENEAAIEEWRGIHMLLIDERTTTEEFMEMLRGPNVSAAAVYPYPTFKETGAYDDADPGKYVCLGKLDDYGYEIPQGFDEFAFLDWASVNIYYNLRNGNIFNRFYHVPVSALLIADPESSVSRILVLLEDEKDNVANDGWKQVDAVNVNSLSVSGIELKGEDYPLLLNAIDADIRAGTLDKVWLGHSAEYYNEYTDIRIRMRYGLGESRYSCSVELTRSAENTIAALRSLGILE